MEHSKWITPPVLSFVHQTNTLISLVIVIGAIQAVFNA
jgi:hypothetical protein